MVLVIFSKEVTKVEDYKGISTNIFNLTSIDIRYETNYLDDFTFHISHEISSWNFLFMAHEPNLFLLFPCHPTISFGSISNNLAQVQIDQHGNLFKSS